MNIQEVFKNAYPDTELERIYDFDGCEVGIITRHENGIIVDIRGFTKFFDEYTIEKYLDEETAQELIEWINENNY